MRRVLVLGVIGSCLAISGCGDTGSPSGGGDNSNMSISEDSSYNAHVLAGSVYTTDMDIKNTGKVDIPKLDIMFDSGDNSSTTT